MLRLGFFVALLLTFASLSQGQNSTASPSLVLHFFRHGARAPLKDTYATDWYGYQLGQLTTVGMRQHYLLGAALAETYPDILGQPYNYSKIYYRSSTLSRSIDSGDSQLYGVYQGRGPALSSNPAYPSERAVPPFVNPNIQIINQNLTNAQALPGGYIAIAANTTSDEDGINLLEPAQFCFNLANNILENLLSDESLQFWADLAPTRQALENAGISVNNPYELAVLGDVLVCDYDDGRTLPGNIDPQSDIYFNVTFARNWYFTEALWGSQEQRQLLSVPLYDYIFKYFDAKLAGTTEFEFMFLSTAETILVDLLATLNIVTADCLKENYNARLAGQPVPYPNCNYTEFASSVILEFYNNGGSPSVVFKYNGVAIPVCSDQTECSYDDFKNLVKQATNGYTADKYQRDCLGRTLPELELIFQRAGYAFEAKNNGSQPNIDSIVSEIKGEGSNNNESGQLGENYGSSSIFHDATENVDSRIESAREKADGFLNNV